MEGLEVSVISNQEINDDNVEFRLDADYYKKEYLNLYNLINEGDHLVDIVTMSDLSSNASFATVSGIVHDGNPKVVPFIRSGNVGNTFINSAELEFISREAHLQLSKSVTKLYDIMMARKGKIGGASLIMENEVNYNCNENVIKLTIKDQEKINPFYFTAYFNSKFGYKQVERLSTGNVQPWVPISQLRKLYFKHTTLDFQKEIEKTIMSSHSKIQQSKSLYTEAENILLAELGLLHWQPTRQSYSTKSFAESYQVSGRLDAEYYQPKYDEIENLVRSYKGGYDTTENICTIKLSNFTPKTEQDYKYIELASITANGIIADVTIGTGAELPTRARRLVATNDVIVSSIEGSLTSCAIIPESLNNSICSTGFYVVNSKKINSETLLLLFKSVLVYPMQKGCSGTILTGINNEEFFKIEIPIIDKSTQSQIAAKIQQSFALQQQSKQLLEAAKTAVEIAIEQDEAAALEYLKLF